MPHHPDEKEVSHLHEVGYGYFKHLYRAWKIAFILLVHGIFPNVWKTKASDLLCKERIGDDTTRAYLLKHMYGIEEKKIKEEQEKDDRPSIWERRSDRSLAILQSQVKNK
jgi:hypothetical protein